MHMACQFKRNIDYSIIFDTPKKRVTKLRDCVYNAFVRNWLPPRPSKCRHQKKDRLTVSGAVFNEDGDNQPDTERMNKVLDTTVYFLTESIWNTARLESSLGL